MREARQRCDQENLIAQLKGGVRALHAPVNTLHANWAYMVMAALAWSLKAWVALWLPIAPRWRQRHAEEQRRLLRMDFRTFLGAFINVPCQVLTQGRRSSTGCSPGTPGSTSFSASLTPRSRGGYRPEERSRTYTNHNSDASPVVGQRLIGLDVCDPQRLAVGVQTDQDRRRGDLSVFDMQQRSRVH